MSMRRLRMIRRFIGGAFAPNKAFCSVAVRISVIYARMAPPAALIQTSSADGLNYRPAALERRKR